MYRIILRGPVKPQEQEELTKIFLKTEEFQLFTDETIGEAGEMSPDTKVIDIPYDPDKNIIKQRLFNALSEETGYRPPWGILTGIRPVKLAGEYMEAGEEDVAKLFEDFYYLKGDNAKLITDMYNYQVESCGKADANSLGIYVGIPFCPTRCVYCSFTSNQVGCGEIAKYLEALHKEIEYCGSLIKKKGLKTESIYIGGGTPTTIDEDQLRDLLAAINKHLRGDACREVTLEAGRPDTITEEKLKVAKEAGVTRISINPQTMKDETLKLIGRNHSVEAIRKAFAMAREAGFEDINADVIAGLPEESLDDFKNTMDELMKLDPSNITIHSLSVKRASRLVEQDKDYHYRQGKLVSEMVMYGREFLMERGFNPYYLYRQKHMSGAQENIGYCKPGCEGIYNIRIMDEHQSILALGAGGVSKSYYPEENRLERVANVSNYQIYIERLDEMIDRKRENFLK